MGVAPQPLTGNLGADRSCLLQGARRGLRRLVQLKSLPEITAMMIAVTATGAR